MSLTAEEYAEIGCVDPDCDGPANDDYLGYCSRECLIAAEGVEFVERHGL